MVGYNIVREMPDWGLDPRNLSTSGTAFKLSSLFAAIAAGKKKCTLFPFTDTIVPGTSGLALLQWPGNSLQNTKQAQAVATAFCKAHGFATSGAIEPHQGASVWPYGILSIDKKTSCTGACWGYLYITCKSRRAPKLCAYTSKGNIGFKNKGNFNVGNFNLGNSNIGDRNGGNSNTGDLHKYGSNGNVGFSNRGNGNTGSNNDGDGNQGTNLTGQGNTGKDIKGQGNQGNNINGQGNSGNNINGQGNSGNNINGQGLSGDNINY